ncbi:hypothetical protein EVAR_35627_1 [Eumeta japonica]|uniref:Uncharacterized protein n=1 Tax=Eumeta variegata TaxID=151549 RepID=A0A4C1WFV4_EUMVA|nr:hypothetical protein EVAR_35627_1 [Eumeta japonica]
MGDNLNTAKRATDQSRARRADRSHCTAAACSALVKCGGRRRARRPAQRARPAPAALGASAAAPSPGSPTLHGTLRKAPTASSPIETAPFYLFSAFLPMTFSCLKF